MNIGTILYPAFGLGLLTFAVGFWLAMYRVHAVRNLGLDPGYFALNRGAKLPPRLVQISQHYDNLFESPVLFYVVCIMIYVTGRTDAAFLALAWSYFALRVIHAWVHTGHNRIRQRRNVFLLSVLVLLVLWLRLASQLVLL